MRCRMSTFLLGRSGEYLSVEISILSWFLRMGFKRADWNLSFLQIYIRIARDLLCGGKLDETTSIFS